MQFLTKPFDRTWFDVQCWGCPVLRGFSKGAPPHARYGLRHPATGHTRRPSGRIITGSVMNLYMHMICARTPMQTPMKHNLYTNFVHVLLATVLSLITDFQALPQHEQGLKVHTALQPALPGDDARVHCGAPALWLLGSRWCHVGHVNHGCYGGF